METSGKVTAPNQQHEKPSQNRDPAADVKNEAEQKFYGQTGHEGSKENRT
jgi:hypothetical protein